MYNVMIISNHKAIRKHTVKTIAKAQNIVRALNSEGIRAYYIKVGG